MVTPIVYGIADKASSREYFEMLVAAIQHTTSSIIGASTTVNSCTADMMISPTVGAVES